MSYEELVVIYPWLDLFLELFKGFAPTVVAVMAIVINNCVAEKRAKKAEKLAAEQRVQNAEREILNTLLDKYIDLSKLSWLCSTCLSRGLMSKEPQIKDSNLQQYYMAENDIYFKSLEILDYYWSVVEKYNFKFGCKTTVDDCKEYIDKLREIGDRFFEFDSTMYDDMKYEITKCTSKMKASNSVIMSVISDRIIELYK